MLFRKRKSAVNDNLPTPAQPTVIGAGAAIVGNIDTHGEVSVAGTVRGTITADLCVIEAGAFVEGEIDAGEIIVSGRVAGPLRGRHVHLRQGAEVEGNITSETIEVDHGARLSGAVWPREAEAPAPTAHLPAAEGPRFSASLWEDLRSSDDGRPLKTIRPGR